MSSHQAAAEGPIGPPHIHHMDTPTAYEAAKLGMWLFLATEILLFGGLFAAFAVFHWMYPEAFHQASTHLNRVMGAVNTVVLLFSSLLAALAVDASQHGNNKKVSLYLAGTIFCGFIFLIIKFFEYKAKYDHGLFPNFGGPNGIEYEQYKAYFGLYYCMTALHGLHVILGMGILYWYGLRLSLRNRFSADYYTPVEVGALYWHLVDLIWIYLFPLLYLIG